MKYYLAYGSNLNIQQMAVRCTRRGNRNLDFKLAFRGLRDRGLSHPG